MNEKSQHILENKLNESIDSLHQDLNNLISQLNNKISLNTSNNIPAIHSKEEFGNNRNKILNDFIQYNPVFSPNFIKSKKIKSKLPKLKVLSPFLSNLCKKEVEKLIEKERIISKRFYSCNLIQTNLDFFTHFIKSNMISIEKWNNLCFRISNSANPSFEDLVSFISLIISENRFEFPLNYLYKSFKHYDVTKRNKILAKVFERFRSDLLYASHLSIPKTSEDLENEMKRISLFCNIPFDLHSHDGQKFFYHCEKAFTDAFLIKIPTDFFDIANVENLNENNIFTMINNSIANTTHIDKSLIESLKFLFTGDYEEMTKFFNHELFKFKLQKELNNDHLLYFMKIRFVKNKKTLISLYNNCKSFISLKSRLMNIEFSDDDINSLFQQNLHLILSFASKMINKTFGELDTNSILETAFSLQLRFEQSKGKIINALLSIYDHTNDDSINSLIIELIDQKPYLFYDPLKSYEKQFELNVDLLDVIGQCMWLMINLQILFEQISSVSSVHRKNDDVYLFSNDSIPISRFEVFPRLLSILKFYKKAPLIAEEICESLSINHLRFNLYFLFAIWSSLLEDIKEFTGKCPLPFEKSQTPNLSKDVYHLFSNKIFDNFEEIEKFLIELKQKENKNEIFTTFIRNFIRLNKCISKLQNCYNLQKLLIPIYNEQLNTSITAPSFELPELSPDFLLDSEFDEKIEKVYEIQTEFTKMLTIAVKFNNYQSDSLYIRNHFDLSKVNRDFSILPYEENVKNNLNEFVIFSMFYSPEEFCVDKPLCDLSTNPSYSKYVCLYEIAFMNQLEKAFFHFNPVKEYFNFSEKPFYNSENNTLSISVIPTLKQVMNIPEDKIEDAYLLISNRIMICHLIRFESAIQSPILHVFNSISNGKLNWNGNILSHLFSEIESHPFNNQSAAIEAFNRVLFYRINNVLISTIFNLCQSKDHDQDVIKSIKETWIEIHKNRIPLFEKDDYLTLKRYLPEWTDLFLPNLNEASKTILINQFTTIDNNLSENLILNPELKSIEISTKDFNRMASVLACSILNSKEKLENCTIEQAVRNITQADLIKHSVSTASSSSIPFKYSSQNEMNSIETIKNLILKKQIDEVNNLSDSINVKMANTSLSTSTKPDFYNEKKNLFKQQLYNPPPVEVWRQFNFEINYRFGKLVQKLTEFLRTPNLTKEKLIEFCQKVTPYISLSENQSYTIQYKDKKPINASIQSDFDRFCQIYSTYIKNSCDEININKENVLLLNQLERCFKDDQYSQWQVNCTTQNSDKILELNEINDKLDELNIQQKEEDEVIKENIKKEYEDLLDDIANLIEQEKLKFGRYQNKLYGNVKNSIQSHILSDQSIENALKVNLNKKIDDDINKSDELEQTKKSNDNEVIKQNETTKTKNNEFQKVQFKLNNQNEEKASSEFPKFQASSGNQKQQNSNENSEFPKVQFILNNQKEGNKNENSELPKYQTILNNKSEGNKNEFPKVQFNLSNQNNENENSEFPKFQAISDNQNEESTNNEFPKFQVNSNNQNNENENNEFPKFQVNENENNEFPNEELKFNHRVLFSPNTNRTDSMLNNDDAQFDTNTECKRSRPPSATTGFLIAGEARPRIPRSPTESDERAPFRITSPPIQSRSNQTTPLKRRSIHHSIFAAYMDHSQIEKVEDEIELLKKEILKIRVVHCMNLFAMEKYFTTKIETTTQEYREINTILWNAKRNFEEDVRSITSKIEQSYNELTDIEAEIEATKAKLEKRKQQNTQLRHWKNVNLQTCDSIQSQLKKFNTSNSLDIDVLTLIKKVEQSRAELEMLMLETQDFEDKLDQQIREPMAAIDYYKRRIQRAKCETAEMRYQAQQKMQQQQQQNYSTEEEEVEEEAENEGDDEDNSKPKYFKFKLNLNKKEEEEEDEKIDKNSIKSNQKFLKFKLKQNNLKNDDDDDDNDEEIGQELEELELEKLQEGDSDEEQEYSDEIESQDQINTNNNKQEFKEDHRIGKNDAKEISEIQKYLILNQEIADLNEKLRQQIREIEERKAKMKPELRESIEQLTTEPQATPRPLIHQSSDKKIYKPTPAPRKRHQKTLK